MSSVQTGIGIDEKGGVPQRPVVGLSDADDTLKRLENAIDYSLFLVEPRPRVQVLAAEGKEIFVVHVFPSARLAALWSSGKKEWIRDPVRTGQGTDYMRPGDVEARILSYGPRAKRIALEQLLAIAQTMEITVYSSLPSSSRGNGYGPLITRQWTHGPSRITEVAPFGIRLSVDHEQSAATGEVWVPYEWLTAFLTRQGWRGRSTLDRDRVGLMLRGSLGVPANGRPLTLTPPPTG